MIVLLVIGVLVATRSSSQSTTAAVPVQPTPQSSVVVDSPAAAATGFAPTLSASVQATNLFAGPEERPAVSERVYATTFQNDPARYLYWELGLTHPQRSARQFFTLVIFLYDSGGTLKSRDESQSYLDPAWASSQHMNRWGPQLSDWLPGTYRFSIFIDGTKVASGEFAITASETQFPSSLSDSDPNHVQAASAISTARQLYELRRYAEAVSASDRALLAEPDNVEAQQLREQILKTMSILGIPVSGSTDVGETTDSPGNAQVLPSFDCAYARTATEKLLCKNSDLARLEREMVAAHDAVLEHVASRDRQAFLAEHLTWFKEWDKTCNDAAIRENEVGVGLCVRRFLVDRTRVLRARIR